MDRWLVLIALNAACRPDAPPPTTAPGTQSPPAPVPSQRAAAPNATAQPSARPEPAEPRRVGEAEDIPPQSQPFEMPIPELPAPGDDVAPSRIKAGEYRCKISREYRFRPCTVAIDQHGRSILTIPHALLALEGVLTDVGKRTNFDGIQTDPRPYGCPFCAERCRVDPESCACKEGPPESLAECVLQPIRFVISKRGDEWRGKIEYHLYSGRPHPEREGSWEYEVDHLSFTMRR